LRERKLRNWQGTLKQTGGGGQGAGFFKFKRGKKRVKNILVYGKNKMEAKINTMGGGGDKD